MIFQILFLILLLYLQNGKCFSYTYAYKVNFRYIQDAEIQFYFYFRQSIGTVTNTMHILCTLIRFDWSSNVVNKPASKWAAEIAEINWAGRNYIFKVPNYYRKLSIFLQRFSNESFNTQTRIMVDKIEK